MDILPFASRVIAEAPWNTAVLSFQNLVWINLLLMLGGAVSAPLSHKTTLFHTGAHFRGRHDSGQAISKREISIFTNEIKDLARIVQAVSTQKTLTNQVPSRFSACATSSAVQHEPLPSGKG
jgi:hypothetical protein